MIDSVKQFKESLIEGITIIENIIEGIGTQIENTKQKIQQLQQKPLQQMNIIKSHEKYLDEERNFFKNVTDFLEMIKFDKNISELIQKLDELDFSSFGQQNQQQSIRVENIVQQPNLDQHSFEIKQEDIKMYEYEFYHNQQQNYGGNIVIQWILIMMFLKWLLGVIIILKFLIQIMINQVIPKYQKKMMSK